MKKINTNDVKLNQSLMASNKMVRKGSSFVFTNQHQPNATTTLAIKHKPDVKAEQIPKSLEE
jgi:hypothetical protein